MEEWVDIIGFESLYQISNKGRVMSFDKTVNCKNDTTRIVKGRILKLIKRRGYLSVNLYKDGVMYQRKVHRLVADAFVPNPNNYTIINHKDSNPENNCVENLEWCTQQYNLTREHRLEQFYVSVGYVKDNLVCTYTSIKDAAADTGASNTAIVDCCQGRIKSAGGLKWEYTVA